MASSETTAGRLIPLSSRAQKQKLENKKSSLISSSRKEGTDKEGDDFNDNLQDVIEQLVNFKGKKPEAP